MSAIWYFLTLPIYLILKVIDFYIFINEAVINEIELLEYEGFLNPIESIIFSVFAVAIILTITITILTTLIIVIL